ncbi:MAG: type II secretion system inner membrane protein GspF [Pseudomonadota bacterium]|nr:type II secretion system inner membrane protein GspF [Pseudomonadota bacterium]
MAAYHFVAVDARGRQRKGVLDGDHPRQVRAQLREQGLMPLEVEEVQRREARAPRITVRRGLSSGALALMTRQLATMLRAGLPVEEALQTVARQTERARARTILLGLRAQVMEGQPLAQGLRQYRHVFPEDYVATVAAGEQTGHLDRVLERLADHTESQQAIRQKVTAALVYPILLAVVSAGIVVAMLAYVVPQVVQVFAGIGRELPWLTRTMIASSDFLRDWGVYLIVISGLLFAGGTYLLRDEGRRARWHRLLLATPVLRRLIVGSNAARFTRTLSILIGSGVPLVEGLRIGAQVLTNLPMRQAVLDGAARVREGSSLFQSLNRTGYFPPMTLHLIASGESSGKLEEMLDQAAQTLERDQEMWVNSLVSVLGPLIILTMGGIVLLIVLSIMLPVFNLNQLVT